MATNHDKNDKDADGSDGSYAKLIASLTPEGAKKLEDQRQTAISRDAERSRAFLAAVRQAPAVVEVAGD